MSESKNLTSYFIFSFLFVFYGYSDCSFFVRYLHMVIFVLIKPLTEKCFYLLSHASFQFTVFTTFIWIRKFIHVLEVLITCSQFFCTWFIINSVYTYKLKVAAYLIPVTFFRITCIYSAFIVSERSYSPEVLDFASMLLLQFSVYGPALSFQMFT